MYQEAMYRHHDAHLLGTLDCISDSQIIIDILAFEVLLKCAIFVETNELRWGRNYSGLWLELSLPAREAIVLFANERDLAADFRDVDNLLKDFSAVFTEARYYFEYYETKTIEEQSREGRDWIDNGAKLHEAKVRYHCRELFCLIKGLDEYILKQL